MEPKYKKMIKHHICDLKEFIFNELHENGYEGDYSELDKQLFQSPSTLRLRPKGFYAIRIFYSYEEFSLKTKLTGRELMTLKNHVQWPYYLPTNHSTLHIFAIKQAFLLKLQGGDVKRWLAEIYQKNS